MGLFISRQLSVTPIANELAAAYLMAPPADAAAAQQQAQARAGTVAAQATAAGDTTFHTGRFLAAVALFFILLLIAVVGDETKRIDATKLYDMATTVLGVIVGFLGGEGTAAATG